MWVIPRARRTPVRKVRIDDRGTLEARIKSLHRGFDRKLINTVKNDGFDISSNTCKAGERAHRRKR
jgi:hypothetical protein